MLFLEQYKQFKKVKKFDTYLQPEAKIDEVKDEFSWWTPLSENQEMKLGICGFSKLKLGIEVEKVCKMVPEEEAEDEEELGVAEESFPKNSQLKLAHLGFHAHPTKTPTRTAIHRGAINTISSAMTSAIVGLCKISSRAEANTIIIDIKWENKWRKTEETLDSIVRKVEPLSTAMSRGFEREKGKPKEDKINKPKDFTRKKKIQREKEYKGAVEKWRELDYVLSCEEEEIRSQNEKREEKEKGEEEGGDCVVVLSFAEDKDVRDKR